MFTGIVTDLGEIRAVIRQEGLVRWTVESVYPVEAVNLGASICHNGCCLTVVGKADLGEGLMAHDVEIAPESLALTTLGRFGVGDRVNLERSLKVGDELGGHIVTGHVDGLGSVIRVEKDGEGWRLDVRAPDALAPLIARKGSIAIDGVSLTVNAVEASVFGVLIIPHTWSVTTLGGLRVGDPVNLEADVLARYVARILAAAPAQPIQGA